MFVASCVAIAILAWDQAKRLRLRRTVRVDEVRFLTSIHAELKAGASLRMALATAAGNVPDKSLLTVRRLALAGVPFDEIAPNLRSLTWNGRRVAAALQVAAVSGGRSAAVFALLAERAVAEADLRREKRTLTAQARLSAAVVAGLPVVWFLFGGWNQVAWLTGSGGVGAAIAGAGVGMEVLGGALVWRLARA